MTISFFHIRVKNNVPHLLTPPYFENRRVTAEKVVSKGVTINYALRSEIREFDTKENSLAANPGHFGKGTTLHATMQPNVFFSDLRP